MNTSPIEICAPRSLLMIENYSNLAAATAWSLVSPSVFDEFMMVFQLGFNDASSFLFKMQQAKDALGSGNKDIPGKLTIFTGKESNRLFVFNIRANELDLANGYRMIRGRIEVTGGTNTTAGGVLFGFDPKTGMAYDQACAEVAALIK